MIGFVCLCLLAKPAIFFLHNLRIVSDTITIICERFGAKKSPRGLAREECEMCTLITTNLAYALDVDPISSADFAHLTSFFNSPAAISIAHGRLACFARFDLLRKVGFAEKSFCEKISKPCHIFYI